MWWGVGRSGGLWDRAGETQELWEVGGTQIALEGGPSPRASDPQVSRPLKVK